MIMFLCVKAAKNRKRVGSHLYKLYNKAKQTFLVSGRNRSIQMIWDTAGILAMELIFFWWLSQRNPCSVSFYFSLLFIFCL